MTHLSKVVAICFLISIGYAKATETYCATVKPTPDGFLALRSGPGSTFPLVGRLLPLEFLWVGTEKCKEDICAKNGNWLFVEGVPRLDGPIGKKSLNTQGWASARYIQQIACPID